MNRLPFNEFSHDLEAMPTSDIAYSNSLKLQRFKERMNKPESVQLNSPFDEMRLLLHKSMDSSANFYRMRGQQDAIEAVNCVYKVGMTKEELVSAMKQYINDADKRWNDDKTTI